MRFQFLFILIIILGMALRFFNLGENPPSLYWDEASLGYNAYSILTSGIDEHGEKYPLDRFIAFGDYKPPGYVYAIVPFMALLGKLEFSVRLPSALAGTGMVTLTIVLVSLLTGNRKLSLLSGLFLAVSPWSVQLSRGAFEANLAAFFNLLAVTTFVAAAKTKKGYLLVLSVIAFVLSFYTFNANRIIAPLMLLLLLALFWKTIKNNLLWLIISAAIALIMLFPSKSFLLDRESRLRYQEVSIFNELKPVEIANTRIERGKNEIGENILHNRRLLFAADFLKHYADHFTGKFLFTHGDRNPRLAVQEMGELYVFDLVFLTFGILLVFKRRDKYLLLLFLWMLITPIPAATARETPHALRTVSILPTLQIFTAMGLYHILYALKHLKGGRLVRRSLGEGGMDSFQVRESIQKLVSLVFCLLFIINIFYYLHDYYIHYPLNYSGEWQYGYKEMVAFVTRVQKDYDQIFVTDSLGRPYIYFAFYTSISPVNFLNQREAFRDWFGFWTVESIGKIKFRFDSLPQAQGKILIVTTPQNMPARVRILKNIKDIKGDTVFVIGERI